jgi:PAS domain S-box-containing protein
MTNRGNTLNDNDWDDDVKKVIEELSIYQIELEQQNIDLMQTQRMLEIKEREYTDLFHNAPHSYIVIDNNTKIKKVNKSFCKLLDRRITQIIEKRFNNFIAYEDKDRFYLFLKKLNTKVKSLGIEVRIKTSTNNLKPCWIEAKKDYQGLFRLSIIDLTEKKKLEEIIDNKTYSLELSESKFRNIVESSFEVFAIYELKTGACKYLSPRIKDLIGTSSHELIESNFRNHLRFVSYDNADRLMHIPYKIMMAQKNGEQFHDVEFAIKSSHMHQKWVSARFGLIRDKNDKPILVTASLRDITKSKNYEHELIKAKNKAEENDKLKSAFLANMSHEIRTPLNAILGFSQILKNELDDYAKHQNSIDIIERSGKRLLDVIDDLIYISKIESGQLILDEDIFDIGTVLKDAFSVFEIEAKKKGVELVYNQGIDTSLMVKSDKAKLTSLIYNLIKNAIKYTYNGKIEFDAKITQDSCLEFYVRDTGIGIPKDKQNAIFNRFVQVNSTKFNEGVGLGLSICKGIVEAMLGKIGFESQIGKGSKFYFKIPIRITFTKPVVKDVVVDTSVLKGKRLFIAEDDLFSYQLIYKMLEDTDMNIIHFKNGQDLMDQIITETPDLVLLDINMPVKTGWECIEEIKERQIDTRIIVQSAYAQEKEKEKFIKYGADACVSKPIKKDELIETMSLFI